MNIPLRVREQWTERPSALAAGLSDNQSMFQLLFERSADAIWLLDPQAMQFVDCNQAAVELMRARDKAELLGKHPAQLSPVTQPDGRSSELKAAEVTTATEQKGTQRFEWVARRLDGTEVPLEVMSTPIVTDTRRLNVIISRDITERKKAEQKILELNQDLERRILERTSELTAANEHLKREIAERLRQDKIQNALFQISEAVHSAGDLDSLFGQIHSIIRTLMPADNFGIAVVDARSATISFPYFTDQFNRPAPGPRPMNEGLVGEVLRTHKPLLTECREYSAQRRAIDLAAAKTPEEAERIRTRLYPVAWLGVPLLAQGVALGVMALREYFNDAAFGENEKQILAFVGEQTAQAIQRKRAEQALRESEEKFRALYEASSQGVILHDEHQMLEVNPACLRILGFSEAKEMIGKHPAETSAPIQLNGESAEVLARKYIAECMAHGSARFEWLARNSQGKEIPIEIILTRIQWGGRQLIQAVFNDISERKRAEAEMLRTLAREKELNQLKTNFVSMVSHEFRTPLGIIQSSAEILRDYLLQLQPEERGEQLESIVKNTQRMAAMMDDILVLSRLDAGRMEFKPATMDLNAFCRRVAAEVLSATERRCPIEVSVSDIPSQACADERLLGHIFTNLLNNAVKYSEPGRSVGFVVQREGAEAVCSIIDKGIGISSEDRRWLFNAFQRGQNVGDRPGTGLGLLLVKRCVELHGGKIDLQSTLGVGTKVTIRLPVLGGES